jgi:hypothetical protein
MLIPVSTVRECAIAGPAEDHLGRVRDVYFDDRRFHVRHLVAEIGHWPAHRLVLVSPWSVRRIDLPARVVQTDLGGDELTRSPDAECDRPVSRQRHVELARYYGFYGFPYQWPEATVATMSPPVRRRGDRHLRSTRALVGYYVHADDDDVGHVADFLFGDAAWEIRHVVVAVGHGIARRRVLVPAGWVSRVSWDAAAITLALPGRVVAAAPTYVPAEAPGPELEARLTRYYGPAPFGAV